VVLAHLLDGILKVHGVCPRASLLLAHVPDLAVRDAEGEVLEAMPECVDLGRTAASLR
jgi:hypothetical protein